MRDMLFFPARDAFSGHPCERQPVTGAAGRVSKYRDPTDLQPGNKKLLRTSGRSAQAAKLEYGGPFRPNQVVQRGARQARRGQGPADPQFSAGEFRNSRRSLDRSPVFLLFSEAGVGRRHGTAPDRVQNVGQKMVPDRCKVRQTKHPVHAHLLPSQCERLPMAGIRTGKILCQLFRGIPYRRQGAAQGPGEGRPV